jgi:hypothetical protein
LLTKTSLERGLRFNRDCASAQYARLLLERNGPPDASEVRRLAQRLLEHRTSAAGIALTRWLPEDAAGQ